jgi:hypothetical protein
MRFALFSDYGMNFELLLQRPDAFKYFVTNLLLIFGRMKAFLSSIGVCEVIKKIKEYVPSICGVKSA